MPTDAFGGQDTKWFDPVPLPNTNSPFPSIYEHLLIQLIPAQGRFQAHKPKSIISFLSPILYTHPSKQKDLIQNLIAVHTITLN